MIPGIRRVSIGFGDLVDEIALQLDVDVDIVAKVLLVYATATARALSAEMAVEIIPRVRLVAEDYYEPKLRGRARRVAVMKETDTRTFVDQEPGDHPLEKEYERAYQLLGLGQDC